MTTQLWSLQSRFIWRIKLDSQALRSAIKSARDQMRKDENLNTDVDRIPQFAWILFLKCFDDFEIKRETLDSKWKSIIPKGYRWKDWASETDDGGEPKKVLTGTDLVKFVNNELFPKLGQMVGGKDREQKDIVASIFKEMNNRFVSGYVLRKVLNIVDNIHFLSSDDIHTMAHMYEQMLVEMRDAAGNSGEFYTPRPVIRFIVNQIKPDLTKSEKILDPACGTGGFLVESLDYMKSQIGSKADNKKLQTTTVYGIEKKPMPYLLGMMNMLLHEIDSPNIIRENTLAKPFHDITSEGQYDVIMTNPPFGGEEEEGISANLPIGMQTSDTALAFLLYIMTSLKDHGRCAIILPDGPLFAGGVATKIKQKLIEEFNLNTIVRLPKSVFEPYTSVATNILFFEKSETTKQIWYYQMKVSDRVKSKAKHPKYSKTKPIEYVDFAELEKWFKNKKENENAWKIDIKDLKDFNLDSSNPNIVDEAIVLHPTELVESFISLRKDMIKIFEEIKTIVNKEIPKQKQ